MDLSRIKPTKYPYLMRFPAKLQFVEKARKILQSELEKANLTQQGVFRMCLSLDEALTNAVEHGSLRPNGEVEFAYKVEPGSVEISVTDFGGYMFNPDYFEHLATVKDWGAGGRGILLIKSIMDEVYFVFNPQKSTRIIMRKAIGADWLNPPGEKKLA
jgi:anti-sigma regulatory factor (Ser/Thr protein kinase)